MNVGIFNFITEYSMPITDLCARGGGSRLRLPYGSRSTRTFRRRACPQSSNTGRTIDLDDL